LTTQEYINEVFGGYNKMRKVVMICFLMSFYVHGLDHYQCRKVVLIVFLSIQLLTLKLVLSLRREITLQLSTNKKLGHTWLTFPVPNRETRGDTKVHIPHLSSSRRWGMAMHSTPNHQCSQPRGRERKL